MIRLVTDILAGTGSNVFLVKNTNKRVFLNAKGLKIGIYSNNFDEEFISLTDIARYKSDDPRETVRTWMRSREVIKFLGLWERIHNPSFKPVGFDRFKNQAGEHAFTMSPEKWINGVNAIGMINKRGRYGGGTFAHSDIAFEFASWISAEFKLYIIKDYHRLKSDESERKSLDWNLRREISKLNYKIHTDAIRENLILSDLTEEQISNTYASEADLLNVALFGMTAKEWNDKYKGLGNLRDNANLHQLLVLANMESYNAILIKQGYEQGERLVLLRELAVEQLKVISVDGADGVKRIEG